MAPGIWCRGAPVLALRFDVLFVVFVGGDDLGLELLHGASGLVDELAKVAGHLGELAGSEEDQEQDGYDQDLLESDPETHRPNITRRSAAYNDPAARSTRRGLYSST